MFSMAENEVLRLLFLLFVGVGDAPPDVVALIPPATYFQVCKIEQTVDKMMELAARDPADPKTQVQQLLALRQLEIDVALLKKAPKATAFRRTLTQIAEGKLAADKQAFAQEYARRVLSRLDGRPI